MVGEDGLADHIDLNFGCPVPKVTRRGGGSALPWRRRLFARLVRQAVEAAAPFGIPLTIKMRKGIDDDHLTYVEAGLIAQEAGVAAVALHARTAEQRYSGKADWDAIATLKQALDVPVPHASVSCHATGRAPPATCRGFGSTVARSTCASVIA